MTRLREGGRRVESGELEEFDKAMSGVTPLNGQAERQPPEPPPALKKPMPERLATIPPAAPAPLESGATNGVDRRTMTRLRRGLIRPEARLDLHGKTLEEARRAVSTFVAASQSDRRRCVLIITGKGARGEGPIRRDLPRWLNAPGNRPRVTCFAQARQTDGGEGAFYVLLKRRRPA